MALTLLVALLPACHDGAGPERQGRRVVIVAAEGASWQVLSSIDRAVVPHLAEMTVLGTTGVLRAEPPLSPAALWTTVATGRSRDAHGIVFDAVKAPGDRALRPITADRRRVPALWSIASGMEVAVGVAGWPATWPAEPVKGFLIADAHEPGTAGQRGDFYPPGALGAGGEGGDVQMLSEELLGAAESDPFVKKAFGEDLATLSQALALQRVHQPRLLMIRLRSIDAVSHRFWHYHEAGYLALAASRGESIPADRARRLAGAVTSAYRFLDDGLGRLQARLPPDTALLVVSAWGMRGVRPTDYLHVDLDGLLARLEEGGTGSASRFFALSDTGRLPRGLHLERRAGPTQPDAEAVREVAAALRGLRTDDGTPLFRLVAPARQPSDEGPAIELMENMEIDPEASLTVGGRPVRVKDLFRRYGDDFAIHDPAGLLLARGAGVARGREGWTAGLLDVAPTALALLGLPLAQDMPGRPIEALLADMSWKDRPPVPTYEGTGVTPVPARRDASLLRLEMQRLEASGHLR